MKESAYRIQYITEYIVSYKAKIEALNKKGLFDTATLFELFAQKICELWFGQKFLNLNSTKANYAYVDLISEDNELYVQVSTAQDVPEKIKTTLTKIHENKDGKFVQIKSLYFFVLSNKSASKVKDYAGPSRIGNIDFIASDHLISTDAIVQRAKTDLVFQKSLYDLLKYDSETYVQTEEELYEAISLSKTLLKNNIDCFLNDEYEIDRSDVVEKIRNENYNFISIQGEAGSGKSVICKKIVEDEELMLFARAEKVAESVRLSDIWNVNINKVMEFLNGRKIVFFIDALEFIADGLKTKFDLLQQLYEIVNEYSNAYIITSCRSCDSTAFTKIESIYNIHRYEVSLLSDIQIKEIAQQYKIIRDLWEEKPYSQLLRSPFYLNLIIKNITDYSKISDVSAFRDFIWTDVICMGNKVLPSAIMHSDIGTAVRKIVFDRATRFVTGINPDEINEAIVDLLHSEGIITSCAGDTIRLKYDIFEDICFEKYIDEKYADCKGDYDVFYFELDKLGRCVYRRYQIWVENKLLTKDNREKFLYKLLKTDSLPHDWKKQTIVGIVKSNFCKDFFEEYERSLQGSVLLEFVTLTNAFSFEARIVNLEHENVYSDLKPIGLGRQYLIEIIHKNEAYKEDSFLPHVAKLCSDYSKLERYDYPEVAIAACTILEYYVSDAMNNKSSGSSHDNYEKMNGFLLPIYRMAEYSHEWIKEFWEERIKGYLNSDGSIHRIDAVIIKYVLKHTVRTLVEFVPQELCRIADTYWLKTPTNDNRGLFYDQGPLDNAKRFGLSRAANSYNTDYSNPNDNVFLVSLVNYNWNIALDWIIQLTNHAANSIKEKYPDKVYDILVWEDNPENSRAFICHPDFWFANIEENRVHELIGDSLYVFTKRIIKEIQSCPYGKEVIEHFAESIKQKILCNSNNILMLLVINEIGRNCKDTLPGYSLFLASSIDLVMLDNQKKAYLQPDSARMIYKQQILMIMSIPDLPDRYNNDEQGYDSLQDYVFDMQLRGGNYKQKAENILDYLYFIIPNQGETAIYNLQIQKMDLRKAVVRKINEKIIELTPEIEGDAKRIVTEQEQSKYSVENKEFERLLKKCNDLLSEGNYQLQDCYSTIDQLVLMIGESDAPGQLQKVLVMIIAVALKKEGLGVNKRSELCSLWLDGIDGIINNDTFIFDIALMKILFEQLDYELSDSVRNRLKKQMLDCLLYKGQNGVVLNIATQIKEYLVLDKKTAKAIFNTIIGISEDKMSRYVYNAKMLEEIGAPIHYLPNRGKPPVWVNELFNENGISLYQDNTNQIIETFLFQENDMDLSEFDIEKCDVQTLCYVSNCGLNLNDQEFKLILEKLFPYMIQIISSDRDYHEYLDIISINEVKTFIEKSLMNNKAVVQLLDMLFMSIDFSKMNYDSFELYDDISCYLLARYFDGYNSPNIRKQCEFIIKEIADRISRVTLEHVRIRLYSMLFLTLGRFHMRDWNALYTEYSYENKMFLCEIWSKYGWLHFDDLLNVVAQMQIKALLPEVIIPLNDSLVEIEKHSLEYNNSLKEKEIIMNMIITKAFLDYKDVIKNDMELSRSFESLLCILVKHDMGAAAVVLDEFRIH